ncbi:MAG TPA: DegQ family serine endoprotease [Burkholderiales bacterium]|nr:DegQ family serine endoprotease [Burkholderiales bacterium]
MSKNKTLALAMALALGMGAMSGAVGTARVAHAQTAGPTTDRGLPDFTQLVISQGPAVVNITVTQRRPQGADQLPFRPGDPMYEFFRRFQIPIPEMQPQPRQGMGSGFIISADGYILTNAHVVSEASEVTVKLTDKRELKAKVIGADVRTDVALLKVDATDLPVVKIGDPEKLRVGEWVAAIGSPFGLENSVTAGIVSAKSRSLPDGSYVPFIQTDVAINPGNSGGPLFTMNGEVVGINSQIYSRTGGYMGLSFSIPIDVAMKVANDLRKFGKVERGRMGVTIQSVSRELAESFGLDRPRGALVSSVEPDSPAAKAGVQPGDIILSAGGEQIEESADLPRIVGQTRPGDTLPMALWRKGKQQSIQVTVGRMPDEEQSAAGPETTPAPPGGKLGIAVRPLTAEERKQANVQSGVVIERVAPGPAATAGLREGDVIIAFNNEAVNTPADLSRLADKAKGPVAALILRDNARIYVPITVK